MVNENVEIIFGYVATLKDSYEHLLNLEAELSATRSNVRTAQLSKQDLEIKKEAAAVELEESKKKLTYLAGTIEDRRAQWTGRVNELEVQMGEARDRHTLLQSKVDSLFTDIFDESTNSISTEFQTEFPVCYETLQPYIMSIYQLMEYEKQLGSNTEVVEAFDGLVEEFEDKYMNVLTNTFGPGVQENINFENLEESVGNIILSEYNRVWEVYNRFTRGYGSAGRTAGMRRMRFAQAMNSWNFFVSGFEASEARASIGVDSRAHYNESASYEEVVDY